PDPRSGALAGRGQAVAGGHQRPTRGLDRRRPGRRADQLQSRVRAGRPHWPGASWRDAVRRRRQAGADPGRAGAPVAPGDALPRAVSLGKSRAKPAVLTARQPTSHLPPGGPLMNSARLAAPRCLVAICALWLAGCGAPDLGDQDVASLMEQDFGGPSGLMDYFQTHTDDEIRLALEPYGVRYVASVPDTGVTPQLITDCPQYFPSSDRNIWHLVSGEYYFIDGSGQPSRAYADLPPIAADVRNDACQASVGQWGDAENPSNDY